MDLSKKRNFKKNQLTSKKLGNKKFNFKKAQSLSRPKQIKNKKNFKFSTKILSEKSVISLPFASKTNEVGDKVKKIVTKNYAFISSIKFKFNKISKPKKALCYLLIAGSILALGYGLSLLIANYANPKTYTEGYYFEKTNINLDPVKGINSGSNQVLMDLLFAKLIRQGPDGKYYPELATITSDEFNKNYTIKFKDGLKWSDDQPINSSDLEFTLNQYKINKNDELATLIKNSEIKIIDTLTLTISLKDANKDLTKYLSSLILAPKHAYQNKVDGLSQVRDDIFSGPYNYRGFQLVSEGLQFKLLKNNNYFNAKKVTNNKVNIRILDTKEKLISDYKSGLVTASTQITNQDLKTVPKYSYKYQTSSSTFLFFNTSNITDLNLRKALSQSINNAEVALAAGYPVMDSFISNNQLGGAESIKQLAYNSEQATQSFNAAGYSIKDAKIIKTDGSAELKLSLLATDDQQSMASAKIIAKQLLNAGVSVNLKFVSNKQLKDDYFKSHNYDMLIYGIDMGYEPDVATYWSSNQKNLDLNFSNLNDPKIEGAITGYTQAKDDTQKVRGLIKLSEIWASAVPAKALYSQNLVLSSNEKIDNSQEGIITDNSAYLNKIPYFKF